MIAEEIGGKELQSHVVVVDVFLRGGISHKEAKDIVAVGELRRAIVVFWEGRGCSVCAGLCQCCVEKLDEPKAQVVVGSMIDFDNCESLQNFCMIRWRALG